MTTRQCHIWNYEKKVKEICTFLNKKNTAWFKKHNIEIKEFGKNLLFINKKANEQLDCWNIICNSLIIGKNKYSDYSHTPLSLPIPFPRKIEFSKSFNSNDNSITLVEFIKGRIIHLFFDKGDSYFTTTNINNIFYDNFGNDLTKEISLKNPIPYGHKSRNHSITFIQNKDDLFLYTATRLHDCSFLNQKELDSLAFDLGVKRPKVWENHDPRVGTSIIENKNKIFNFMAIDEFNEHCMITSLTEMDKISINNLSKEDLIDIWKQNKDLSAKRYNNNCIGFYKEWDSFCNSREKTIYDYALHHFRYDEEEIRQNLKKQEEWIISIVIHVCFKIFGEASASYNFDAIKPKIKEKIKEVSSGLLLKSFWEFSNTPRFESPYESYFDD